MVKTNIHPVPPKKLHTNRCQSRPRQARSVMPPLPVPDPTTSRLGDSAMASASRSRRPSSVCSMEDMCRSPKPSGQLPHTSSRVTLRSKVPAANMGHRTLSPRCQTAGCSFVYPPPTPLSAQGPFQLFHRMDEGENTTKHVCVGQNETARATGSECRPPGNDLHVCGLVIFKLCSEGRQGSSQVFRDKGREPSSQVQPTHLNCSLFNTIGLHLRIHLKQGLHSLNF